MRDASSECDAALVNLGQIHAAQREPQAALGLYQKAERRAASAPAASLLALQARAHFDAGALGDARRVLARALHQRPYDLSVRFNLATVLYRAAKPPRDGALRSIPDLDAAAAGVRLAVSHLDSIREAGEQAREAAAAGGLSVNRVSALRSRCVGLQGAVEEERREAWDKAQAQEVAQKIADERCAKPGALWYPSSAFLLPHQHPPLRLEIAHPTPTRRRGINRERVFFFDMSHPEHRAFPPTSRPSHLPTDQVEYRSKRLAASEAGRPLSQRVLSQRLLRPLPSTVVSLSGRPSSQPAAAQLTLHPPLLRLWSVRPLSPPMLTTSPPVLRLASLAAEKAARQASELAAKRFAEEEEARLIREQKAALEAKLTVWKEAEAKAAEAAAKAKGRKRRAGDGRPLGELDSDSDDVPPAPAPAEAEEREADEVGGWMVVGLHTTRRHTLHTALETHFIADGRERATHTHKHSTHT